MLRNPREFAALFGAKIIGEAPEVGGGPFGMAQLAHLMHQRLTPSQGERPGRPTDSSWASRPKVPMSEATQRHLAEIAAAISTPDRRVSPMQVAAQLLEEAVVRVCLQTENHASEHDSSREDQAGSEGVEVQRPRKDSLPDAGQVSGNVAASAGATGGRGPESKPQEVTGAPNELPAGAGKKVGQSKTKQHPMRSKRSQRQRKR